VGCDGTRSVLGSEEKARARQPHTWKKDPDSRELDGADVHRDWGSSGPQALGGDSRMGSSPACYEFLWVSAPRAWRRTRERLGMKRAAGFLARAMFDIAAVRDLNTSR
jgi:hypothetical protein